MGEGGRREDERWKRVGRRGVKERARKEGGRRR